MQNFKAEIELQFGAHLGEHPFWQAFAVQSPAEFQAVRETLLAPAKRLRPLLFCTACRAAGRDPFPELAPVVLALELAHSFVLIHDDIIDSSAERRGAPTLQKRIDDQFAADPADGFTGADVALVTGDLLYTLAIESLLLAEATDAQKTEAVRLFTRAALDTGRGALLEMRAAQTPLAELTVKEVENIYALKTGTYTFMLPLQLAAVFSNGWKNTDDFFQGLEKNLPRLGRSAGIAFQLKNDLKDLRQWIDGGPLPDDIRDDRRIWPLVYAGSVEALRRPEVLEAVEAAMEEHAQRAMEFIQDPDLKAMLQLALF